MSASPEDPRPPVVLLAAWALFVSGCHGWLPALLRPVVLAMLGSALLLQATAPRCRGGRGLLSLVPLLAGIWAAQRFAVDLVAAAGLLVGLALVPKRSAAAASGHRPMLADLVVGNTLVMLVSVQLLLGSTVGHHLEASLAEALNGAATAITGQTIRLGPTFGGARVLLVGVVLLLAATPAGARRWALLLSMQVALAVVASIGVGLLAEALPPFGSTSALSPRHAVAASQLPWLPFVLGLVPPWLATRVRPAAAAVVDLRVRMATLATVVAACLLASLPPSTLRPCHKAVFYKPGFSNWDVADADLETAGPYSTGMMGSLPQFARALGLRAELVERLDAEVLADCDVLVLVNQHAPLPTEALTAIGAWNAAGGHLLAIGDHTFLHKPEGHADYELWLNQPLAATSIRFGNNSADHLTAAFLDATVTCGLGRQLGSVPGNPYSPIIGAGLELGWPARPIVIGRYGYEDAAHIPTSENDDTLGNLTWDPGERLGDVVLIAEQQVGRGRVTVVGDTTGFHNVARTMVWRHAGALLVGSERDAGWLGWGLALALCGLAAAVWTRRWPARLGATSAVGLMAALATLGNLERGMPRLCSAEAPLMILDTAVRPQGPLGDWKLDGHLTMVSSALRAGLLPLFTSTVEHGIPVGAQTIVLSRPQVHPGADWERQLLGFVRQGGHLVMAAGYDSQALFGGLLAEVGCAIEPLVLGPQSVDVIDGEGQRFQVRLQESWNLALLGGEWSRWVYSADTTTMASRPLGKGRVTVVTDATFLQNRNLENEATVNRENLRFVMQLLRRTGASR